MFWLKWLANWSEALQGTTIVCLNDISDSRTASVDMPDIVSGTLDESRDSTAYEIRRDWSYSPSDSWMLNLGFRAGHQEAEYRHSSMKSVSPPFDQFLDNAPFVSRDLELSP